MSRGGPEQHPRARASRYVAKALPPPVTSLELALNYAGAALDRSIPLLDRWNFVSTAVRLLSTDPAVAVEEAKEALPRRLRASGLCEMLVRKLNYDVCVKGEVIDRLVRLVNAVELGEVPVTDRLVEILAQSVVVLVAPVLEVLRSYTLYPEGVR